MVVHFSLDIILDSVEIPKPKISCIRLQKLEVELLHGAIVPRCRSLRSHKTTDQIVPFFFCVFLQALFEAVK